jgi:hypothetical protein
MSVADKFLRARDRLVAKMRMSQTPVPGLLMGLSGTDSIIAFTLVYEAAEIMGIADRVWGIHYADHQRRKPTWFEANILWWLARHCPSAKVECLSPLGGNFDPQRWADLHLRALNHVAVDEFGSVKVTVRDPGENFWVVGTMNNTEKALGTYTALAKSVSVQPINVFSKTEILELCRLFEVPAVAEEYARIPDCFCGRDELAAQNIEAIDAILTARIDPRQHDPDLLAKLYEYIRETKALNGFKDRTPYFV